MVLKLTFSVDYEDAHPHVQGQCALGLALPLPKKNPPPFSPKFSHNIYISVFGCYVLFHAFRYYENFKKTPLKNGSKLYSLQHNLLVR